MCFSDPEIFASFLQQFSPLVREIIIEAKVLEKLFEKKEISKNDLFQEIKETFAITEEEFKEILKNLEKEKLIKVEKNRVSLTQKGLSLF